MNQHSDPVVVLGAGIVGVCTAAQLQRRGHQVVLVDRQVPGEAASYGNAGCLNGSSIIPVAMPGVLKNVPKWLLQPDGPLVLRWNYLPRMVPWLLRFIASSSPEKVEAQCKALRDLLQDTLGAYAPLLADAGISRLVQHRGHLVAYSSEAGYAGDALAMELRRANGVVVDEVDRDSLRDMEPNLAPGFLRARMIRETGHTSDPGKLLEGLTDHVLRRGARLVRADVRGFEVSGNRVTGVKTSGDLLRAGAVVVALGAWSANLARQLGDRVLLDTERGYHVELAGSGFGPGLPTLWAEGKIVATPMDGRIRCAGTVELAGLRAAPKWERSDLLLRQLQRMYPAASAHAEKGAATHWMGFRPSTPDSLPVIGRAGAIPNAYYAFGHGHIGLTAGAKTGELVADVVSGVRPSIDLTPFSVSRFTHSKSRPLVPNMY